MKIYYIVEGILNMVSFFCWLLFFIIDFNFGVVSKMNSLNFVSSGGSFFIKSLLFDLSSVCFYFF